MRASGSQLAALALLALGTACAPQGPPRFRRIQDRNVLTQQQMLEHHFASVYDAVQALRSNWMRTRGPDSFLAPTPVWVYFETTKLGGVESLRAVDIQSVMFVRYYDGLAASGRFGVGHGQGVIYLSSHPR
jgi:hypothetical protein